MNILTTEIKKALDENKRVIVLAGNEAGSKKIEALLEPEEIKYKYFEKLEDSQEKIYKNSIEEYFKNKTVIIGGRKFKKHGRAESNGRFIQLCA